MPSRARQSTAARVSAFAFDAEGLDRRPRRLASGPVWSVWTSSARRRFASSCSTRWLRAMALSCSSVRRLCVCPGRNAAAFPTIAPVPAGSPVSRPARWHRRSGPRGSRNDRCAGPDSPSSVSMRAGSGLERFVGALARSSRRPRWRSQVAASSSVTTRFQRRARRGRLRERVVDGGRLAADAQESSSAVVDEAAGSSFHG